MHRLELCPRACGRTAPGVPVHVLRHQTSRVRCDAPVCHAVRKSPAARFAYWERLTVNRAPGKVQFSRSLFSVRPGGWRCRSRVQAGEARKAWRGADFVGTQAFAEVFFLLCICKLVAHAVDFPVVPPLASTRAAVNTNRPGKTGPTPARGQDSVPEPSMRRRIAGCRAVCRCPFTRSSPLSSEETPTPVLCVQDEHAGRATNDVVRFRRWSGRDDKEFVGNGQELPRDFAGGTARMLLVS